MGYTGPFIKFTIIAAEYAVCGAFWFIAIWLDIQLAVKGFRALRRRIKRFRRRRAFNSQFQKVFND